TVFVASLLLLFLQLWRYEGNATVRSPLGPLILNRSIPVLRFAPEVSVTGVRRTRIHCERQRTHPRTAVDIPRGRPWRSSSMVLRQRSLTAPTISHVHQNLWTQIGVFHVLCSRIS